MTNIKIILFLLVILSIAGLSLVKDLPVSNDTSNTAGNFDNKGVERQNDPPGFEAVFAILGLLGVASLVLRQKGD